MQKNVTQPLYSDHSNRIVMTTNKNNVRTGGNMKPFFTVAMFALVLPVAAIGTVAAAFGEAETSLPQAFSTAPESMLPFYDNQTHAEYVEIYEDSTIEMFAAETFEDATVLSVENIRGFNTEGLSAYLQTVQQKDDGEIRQNIIIEIPQPSEEQNDAVIVYNVGASIQQ
jgi:hypothetical protein